MAGVGGNGSLWFPFPNYGNKMKKVKGQKGQDWTVAGVLGTTYWRQLMEVGASTLSGQKKLFSSKLWDSWGNDVVAPEMPRIWIKMILFRRDRLSEMLVMKVWNDGLTKLVCILLTTCLDFSFSTNLAPGILQTRVPPWWKLLTRSSFSLLARISIREECWSKLLMILLMILLLIFWWYCSAR